MNTPTNLFIFNANTKHPSKYPLKTWERPRCQRPPKWQGHLEWMATVVHDIPIPIYTMICWSMCGTCRQISWTLQHVEVQALAITSVTNYSSLWSLAFDECPITSECFCRRLKEGLLEMVSPWMFPDPGATACCAVWVSVVSHWNRLHCVFHWFSMVQPCQKQGQQGPFGFECRYSNIAMWIPL